MTENPPDNLRVVDNREVMRYEIWAGDELAGYATYRVRPGQLVFVHTETEPGYEGHGVAAHLIQAALDDLRSRNFRVVPLCPYVAHYVEEHPEYADLLVG